MTSPLSSKRVQSQKETRHWREDRVSGYLRCDVTKIYGMIVSTPGGGRHVQEIVCTHTGCKKTADQDGLRCAEHPVGAA